MMTFTRYELASFSGSRSRENMTAEEALQDISARFICGVPTGRLASARALCDSVAQKAGKSLKGLSAHALADLLRGVKPQPTATENGRIVHPPAGGQIASDKDVTLYLQHGEPGEPMRTEAVITAVTAAPANPYLSGYGAKVPTRYMVRYGNRWHRVYCRVFSNVGSLYIETRDGPIRVTEYR